MLFWDNSIGSLRAALTTWLNNQSTSLRNSKYNVQYSTARYTHFEYIPWNMHTVCTLLQSGIWFNIKTSSYQYRKSHCGDKTVVRSSYLHNGISYTGKMSSLYWIGALVSLNATHILQGCFTGTGQSYDCPSASEATLKNMDQYNINYSCNQDKTQQNKNTVHNLWDIYCQISNIRCTQSPNINVSCLVFAQSIEARR